MAEIYGVRGVVGERVFGAMRVTNYSSPVLTHHHDLFGRA